MSEKFETMDRADNNRQRTRETWGVLGGMGPLASAEFMRTIYEQNIGPAEQVSPSVLLLSDPSIPDRTECLRNGEEQILIARLSSGISQLISAGATRIIICCLTIHCLLPFLETCLRDRVVSLVDLIFDAALRGGRKSLLLCTAGSVFAGVFERHDAWKDAQNLFVFPCDEDQKAVHGMIYDIKMNQLNASHLSLLDSMMQKYQVDSYTAGCTELHILTRERARIRGYESSGSCIDPLAIAASMMSHSAGSLHARSSH